MPPIRLLKFPFPSSELSCCCLRLSRLELQLSRSERRATFRAIITISVRYKNGGRVARLTFRALFWTVLYYYLVDQSPLFQPINGGISQALRQTSEIVELRHSNQRPVLPLIKKPEGQSYPLSALPSACQGVSIPADRIHIP